MKEKIVSRKELLKQIESLTERLIETEDALRAIQNGEVDAIVVSGKEGEQIFSLSGAETVYRLIVETMNEAALTTSLNGTILFCNEQFGRLMESPMERLIGRSLADLVLPESRRDIESLLTVRQSNPLKMRVLFQNATRPVPVQMSASLLSQPEGNIICLVAMDLTMLEQRQQQLRNLTLQLGAAEQKERSRIAGVLHDNLQQILVGARFQVDLLIGKSDSVCIPIANRINELLNESITASRSLTMELNPPLPHKGDLTDSVKWLAKWMHSRHGISVNVEVYNEISGIEEETALLLFQSVRELLLNVVKHANTNSASIHLSARDSELHVTVMDSGTGFDPEIVARKIGQESFGLFSIQERLSYIGGKMDTESAPGKGSRFMLSVPLGNNRSGAI